MDIPQFLPIAPEYTTNVPAKLKGNTGKDNFEDLLMQAATRMKKRLTMGRYGVTAVRRSATDIMLIPSKPDFSGLFRGGQSFDIEAKVITKPSFPLGPEFFKESQYAWLRNRALYGAACYLAVHFNERVGKTFHDKAFTVLIPVHPDMPLWRGYEDKTIKSITKEMAKEVGTIIPWTTPKGTKKPLPHFI